MINSESRMINFSDKSQYDQHPHYHRQFLPNPTCIKQRSPTGDSETLAFSIKQPCSYAVFSIGEFDFIVCTRKLSIKSD